MDASTKSENLRCLYQELHSSRRDAETFHNRVAFAFSSVFLLVAGLIAQGDHTVDVTVQVKLLFCTTIVIAVLVGLAYIRAIASTNRERYSMIVRVEQALGFHTMDEYITSEAVASFDHEPYPESSLLPERSRHWGQKEVTEHSMSPFVKANMLSVASSGFVAIVVVALA